MGKALIEDYILGMVNALMDSGELDPYEYTGVHESQYPKPYEVSLGGKVIAHVEFVMSAKEDGDYDGCEGFNVWMKEK